MLESETLSVFGILSLLLEHEQDLKPKSIPNLNIVPVLTPYQSYNSTLTLKCEI